MTSNIRLLETHQTQTFDVEYVDKDMFTHVKSALIKFMPSNSFSFIDVGGGNGQYADLILNKFPDSQVTIVEPDNYLLSKNSIRQRKTLIPGIYQDTQLGNCKHDVVSFNWVLHHFVGKSYSQTIKYQNQGLEKAYHQLKPGGLLFIFENFYDGFIFKDLPSHIIHSMTASKVLQPVTKRLGANTAGVGVCFHSEQTWLEMLRQQGFSILSNSHCYDFGNLSVIKKALLHIRKQHVGFIVAQKNIE